MREWLYDRWCEAKEMTASIGTVLFLAAALVGLVAMWNSCAVGKPPLQQLRDGNR